jgi:microcystin-dependent protein
MFSDFFEVPAEWKAQMRADLERDPPILGKAALGGGLPTGLLVGEIKAWPFGVVPDAHWAFCDGQTVARSLATHERLHTKVSALGYPSPFGPGDGSTTWTMPNLKGKVLVHKDAGDASFDVVGETGGAKTVTLTLPDIPSHAHGPGSLRHLNPTEQGTIGSNQWVYKLLNWDNVTQVSFPLAAGGVTDAVGGGGAHNNVQPYVVIPMIIYLG